MPKAHDIGPLFLQVTNFPYKWGGKLIVRGWTQEIEPPYRTSKPFIVRLPFYKALVLGRWSGTEDEETALNSALGRRDLTYDDFTEEAGWTPAPESSREESSKTLDTGFDFLDGALDVRYWQESHRMAEEQRRRTP
jgi:hypothetical protein